MDTSGVDEAYRPDLAVLLETGQFLHDPNEPVRYRRGTRSAEPLPRVIQAPDLWPTVTSRSSGTAPARNRRAC